MKFGVILPNFGPQASRLSIVDTALAAESQGFDSVWATDHLALPKADADRFGTIYEAITTLSFLAASTRKIRLGISALVLPQRNPVEVAKAISTLDALSGGRTMLAAGIGWSAGEYANLGQNFKNRGKRMDDALKAVRTLWRGAATTSFKGKYYQFEQVVVSPKPVQSGGPALWVAGVSETALRRAIFYADGWHPTNITAEQLQQSLHKARPMLGHRPFDVSLRLKLGFSSEPEPGMALSGSSQQIIEALQAYQSAGMNYAVLDFQVESLSQAAREKAMQRFQKEIAPVFAQD